MKNKARILYEGSRLDFHERPIHDYCKPVLVLDGSPRSIAATHKNIRVALDSEDGTGAGYDHAAWSVMRAIGLTSLTFPRFLASLGDSPVKAEEGE